MNIDTVHQVSQTLVKICITSKEERALSDDDWRRIAFNQHRLIWLDGRDGAALLPRRIVGVMPKEGATRVERPDADHVVVTFIGDAYL